MLKNMRLRGLQLFLSTGAAVLLCSYILYETGADLPDSEENAKEQVLMQVLMSSLKNGHYETKELNDEFSADAFDLYIKRLDFGKRFLLQEDIDALLKHRMTIDDEIMASEFKLFDESYKMINKRVSESQDYYKEFLAAPFDFTINEDIELDEEKRMFASNKKELKDYWRRYLKYQVLARVVEMEDEQKTASEENDTLTILGFDEMEAKARKNLLKTQDRWFDRMMKSDRDDRMNVYINSIMNVFGPHTGYFPPKDKENFDIQMSGQLEGIGAQLQEKDGYIKVSNIVPGSASYLQGELQKGDVIMKVGQGKKEPVDVVNMRLDDAVKLIRGKKGTEVRLTVKKVDGVITIIPIVRDIVVLEETYAKSAILTNDEKGKVGYIRLPKFYADFSQKGGRSASDDVRKEIEKLKAENVEGIVLDLRSNGGGSLADAIGIVGHFIEKGPVVQVKSRAQRPRVMRDEDPTVSYDGPLVVMTNQFSASASEIVAAAIQDYDRGIVFGSKSSFGKGTVQRFFDLDRSLTPAYRQYQPLGAVKITIQKFYRINGGATQLRGVVPDVIVPDQYDYLDMGESENEFVMDWDEIEPATYGRFTPSYDESQVVKQAQSRILTNPTMQLVAKNSKRLKEQSEDTRIQLNVDNFRARMVALDEASEEFSDMMKDPIADFEVENIGSDYERLAQDSVKLDINEKWLKKLRKDVFLNEATYLISDIKAQGS